MKNQIQKMVVRYNACGRSTANVLVYRNNTNPKEYDKPTCQTLRRLERLAYKSRAYTTNVLMYPDRCTVYIKPKN